MSFFDPAKELLPKEEELKLANKEVCSVNRKLSNSAWTAQTELRCPPLRLS